MSSSVTELSEQLRFQAPESVHDALEELGRTEDVSFSPSGRRLAIACYSRRCIAVADVELEDGRRRIEIADIDFVEPEALREPHGIGFADEDTVLVADRASGIHVLAIHGGGVATSGPAADPSAVLDSPGSLVVRALDKGGYEVLACNNWTSTLARHVLDRGSLADGEIVARRRLDLPDSLALSSDGEWLAVSNHNTHTVLVYAYPSLGEESEPVGVLRGVTYPHGLCFAEDDRVLAVADAGAPYVHVFSTEDGWEGARYPSSAIRAMDEATFTRGHRTPREGGPKGIDLHPQTGVLAVTSEHQPLAFFDLHAALDAGRPAGYDEALRQYELHVLSTRQALASDAEATRAALAEVLSTRAWRLTAPLRRLNAVARTVRRRRTDA